MVFGGIISTRFEIHDFSDKGAKANTNLRTLQINILIDNNVQSSPLTFS